MGEASALPILELRLEHLQDNILAAVGDALTTLLKEELAAKSAAKLTIAESAEVEEEARSTEVKGKAADSAPTDSET